MKRPSKSVVIAISTLVGVAILSGLGLAWQIGVFPDYGLESGYYAQFNRVKHTIERMPDVRIVDHWMHKDISLEDFGFTLQVDGERVVQVDFTEGSPQMAERRDEEIREFVERTIAIASIGPGQ